MILGLVAVCAIAWPAPRRSIDLEVRALEAQCVAVPPGFATARIADPTAAVVSFVLAYDPELLDGTPLTLASGAQQVVGTRYLHAGSVVVARPGTDLQVVRSHAASPGVVPWVAPETSTYHFRITRSDPTRDMEIRIFPKVPDRSGARLRVVGNAALDLEPKDTCIVLANPLVSGSAHVQLVFKAAARSFGGGIAGLAAVGSAVALIFMLREIQGD